jgi:hypothetical protein
MASDDADHDHDLDPDALAAALERFGGSPAERRVVARQARDLADSGRTARDRGRALTVATVIEQLADAPDGGPAERWNWWLGALEAAYGGYEPFQVRRIPRE